MTTKLYAILVRHIAPKDNHESIETYVLADDETVLRDRVDREFARGIWRDRDDGGETWTILDEDGEATGEVEGYLDRMLRVAGDFNDAGDDSLWEDAYYGRTHFGWDLGREIDEQEIAVLLALGVAQDWRQPVEGTVDAPQAPTPSMTALEAVKRLDSSEYRLEGSKGLFAEMKAAGLVAVFGASDDLMEFEGAIYDEFSAYEGGKAYVTAKGKASERKLKDSTLIKALWCAEEGTTLSWTYETAIPHATFNVFEDGEIYCRGIVFALADVPAPAGS